MARIHTSSLELSENSSVSRMPSHITNLVSTIAELVKPEGSRKEWEHAITGLWSSFNSEKNARARGDLAWWLGPLTDRLGAPTAEEICIPAAENLAAAMAKEKGNIDERGFSLVQGLGAMLIRLPRDQAVKTVSLLAAVAEATKGDRSSRTADFYDLIRGLEASDAARLRGCWW